jgi:hypothetical protein
MGRSVCRQVSWGLAALVVSTVPAFAGGAVRSPVLTIESNFTFPPSCDTGGCVDASQSDQKTFVFRDGTVLEISTGGTPNRPFTTRITERQVTRLAFAELRGVLSQYQVARQVDCAAGGADSPRGEELWTWYGPGGAYHRFRVHFPRPDTGELPRCPQSVHDFRFAAYFAIRDRSALLSLDNRPLLRRD